MSEVMIGVFGALSVICAVLVLCMRQPMRAALGLVGMMTSLAAIYACLGVHVVAVFQVLIYVGAVMVFMVYTIMLLDERDASYKWPYNRLVFPSLVVAVLCAIAFAKLLTGQNAGPASGFAGDVFPRESLGWRWRSAGCNTR